MNAPPDENGERSHEPTQRKLDEARKRGDIPLSADLVTAAAYGGLALAGLAGGQALLTAGEGLRGLLAGADRMADVAFGGAGPAPLLGSLLGLGLQMAAPWLALPAALAVLALVAQQAPVLAAEKLQPRLHRLSPLAGLRNRLGPAGLVEFGKSLAKLLALGAVLGLFLAAALPEMLGLARLEVGPGVLAMFSLVLRLIVVVVLVSAVFGLADLLWQRLSHLHRQRMTRQEMVEEHKESEGDPAMKGQRRQRGRALALNQMLAEVPKAAVVIVNPTHYAVALKWDRRSPRAPVCVAKGTDLVAARIREAAAAAGVPIHRDPPTARALFAGVEVGAEIGRDHYRAVAVAIRFAERLRQRAGARG